MTATDCTCSRRRRLTRTHQRGCPLYEPPTPWRLCTTCGGAVRIVAVVPHLAMVRTRCGRCGRESVEDVLDRSDPPTDRDDEHDDQDEEDDR